VGRQLILETRFLVDLERETRQARLGPAVAFLEHEADANLFVTFTTAGELYRRDTVCTSVSNGSDTSPRFVFWCRRRMSAGSMESCIAIWQASTSSSGPTTVDCRNGNCVPHATRNAKRAAFPPRAQSSGCQLLVTSAVLVESHAPRRGRRLFPLTALSRLHLQHAAHH
jgi:hypothetical protein